MVAGADERQQRTGICHGSDLVYEILAMVVRELLRANYAVHICLHKFLWGGVVRVSGLRAKNRATTGQN
jgi:hypothetical protein